ncbi:tRNA (adenosine(37)-N6)-threonylcarbamoyltransferase complex ATPase subunit type 1 TsaE [Patescibacteria group bacterium]|nr:tRNA (adenosine(37)-N6)-threonylcarbamoyltransferase complex ATPase subunit type 1 TsaE [Patescibacteria group bacterium]MCG2695302.1 tRNA (adenosine(37)-N6)-threonylcarbamoyltransferase complex ATPase subunit type 1 TsaE [Candidatus Parcubacteria bacterium]
MKKVLKNLKEMEKFAQSVANKIHSAPVTVKSLKQSSGKAVIFALYGNLGSGKTTFTKSFISAFGVKQTVTSPTFVIEKIYKLPKLFKQNKKLGNRVSKSGEFKHIIHIDAYRLNSGEEMKSLGWEEISNDPKNIILIEWPEKIADILLKDTKKIKFKFIDENKREIAF